MGRAVHWFFSVGTAAKKAVYYREGEVPLHTITNSVVRAQHRSLSLSKAKVEAEGRLVVGRDAARLGALLVCRTLVELS